MKTLFNLLLISLFASTSGNCQTDKKDRNSLINKDFPNLSAETLSGKAINFPKDTKGKFTIICIAFSDNAQPLADTWTKAVLEKYPNNEVNYFEVPMLKKGLKFMRGIIDGGMRRGVAKNLHDKVATYYGKLPDYKTQLLMPDDDGVYVFLLDINGKIVATTEDTASPEKTKLVFQKIK
jgi:ATP10 protein